MNHPLGRMTLLISIPVGPGLRGERFCCVALAPRGSGPLLDVSRMALNRSKLEAVEARPSARLRRRMRELGKPERSQTPDEQRRVGHYWLRDPPACVRIKLSRNITFEIDQSSVLAKGRARSQPSGPPEQRPFTDVLWIGIWARFWPWTVARSCGALQQRGRRRLSFLRQLVDRPALHSRTLTALAESATGTTLVL